MRIRESYTGKFLRYYLAKSNGHLRRNGNGKQV